MSCISITQNPAGERFLRVFSKESFFRKISGIAFVNMDGDILHIEEAMYLKGYEKLQVPVDDIRSTVYTPERVKDNIGSIGLCLMQRRLGNGFLNFAPLLAIREDIAQLITVQEDIIHGAVSPLGSVPLFAVERCNEILIKHSGLFEDISFPVVSSAFAWEMAPLKSKYQELLSTRMPMAKTAEEFQALCEEGRKLAEEAETVREKWSGKTCVVVEKKISKQLADRIQKYLTAETREECLAEDETITVTVDFGDGVEMAIQCGGVPYREGKNNAAWTQAVLSHNGCNVCVTEPGDKFLGSWTLGYDSRKYTAIITVAE